VVEAYCPCEQGTGKGSIMGMSGPEQEVDGQAGAATEQGMHPIAPQERPEMVSRSVPYRGIGILSTPRQDRGAIDDQIAGADQSAAHSTPHREHKEGFKGWGTCRLPAFAQLRRAGNARLTIGSQGQATG
jgi:hypothetical protein